MSVKRIDRFFDPRKYASFTKITFDDDLNPTYFFSNGQTCVMTKVPIPFTKDYYFAMTFGDGSIIETQEDFKNKVS